MTNKIKVALAVGIVGGSIFGGYMLAQEMASPVSYEKEIAEAVEETARRYETQLAEREGDLSEIVSQLKQEVVARLRRDESGGEDSGGDLFYTHDPSSAYVGTCARIGGKRNIQCDSWGVMQFKLTTVIHYYKVLYGEVITQKQALVIALDDDKAEALASDIIFNVEGGVWEWSAANNDSSYYAYQVPFIRSLTEKVEGK